MRLVRIRKSHNLVLCHYVDLIKLHCTLGQIIAPCSVSTFALCYVDLAYFVLAFPFNGLKFTRVVLQFWEVFCVAIIFWIYKLCK